MLSNLPLLTPKKVFHSLLLLDHKHFVFQNLFIILDNVCIAGLIESMLEYLATLPPLQPRLESPFVQPNVSDSLGVNMCSLLPKGPATHRYAPPHSLAIRDVYTNYLQKVTVCGVYNRVSVLL